MSVDIDMQSYAGANDSDAAGHSESNSYLSEAHEGSPVNLDAYETADSPAVQQPTRQELNFEALRLEIDRMKAEREAEKREHDLQLDILRANAHQQPQRPVEEPKMFGEMSDNDIPSVGDFRKEWSEREKVYQARIEELQVAQRHPDYAEVLDKYLKPLVTEKPVLASVIQNNPQAAALAYELGTLYRQARSNQEASVKNINAQRMVENSRKPGTLAQTGGQAALSQADYYASMSDSEFYQLANRNLGQI